MQITKLTITFFSPDMEVRRRCLHIALAMVTSRNVEEVVLFLKKQLARTLDTEYEKVRLSICDLILTYWRHARTRSTVNC